MKQLTIAIYIFFVTLEMAQCQPVIEWENSIGGTFIDGNIKTIQTSDGGYITANMSYSSDIDVSSAFGGKDIWIAKLNTSGNIEWENSFGGSGDEMVRDIKQTSDGGYILAGYTDSNDGDITTSYGDDDVWILKISSLGALEWQESFGGSGEDRAMWIDIAHDGGYILGGYANSTNGDVSSNIGGMDYWVLKVSELGILEWEKSFGGSGQDKSSSMSKTSDIGYCIGGYTGSNDGDISFNNGSGIADAWILKIDVSGTIVWETCFGGSLADECTEIKLTSDNGFIFSGAADSNDGDLSNNNGSVDLWIVKISNAGQLEWSQSFGGSSIDNARSIVELANGDFIAGGSTQSNDLDIGNYYGAQDAWLVCVNSSGDLMWETNLGGSIVDYISSINNTADGGIILGCTSSSNDIDVSNNYGAGDSWIVKLSGLQNLIELNKKDQELMNIFDLIGRESKFIPNTPLIYLYSDGRTERVFRVE